MAFFIYFLILINVLLSNNSCYFELNNEGKDFSFSSILMGLHFK